MNRQILVIHAQKDFEKAWILAAELERCGYGVLLQSATPGLPRISSSARRDRAFEICAICLWSHHSVKQESFRAEALTALKRGPMISVLVDRVSPPQGFRGARAVSLIAWSGGFSNAHFGRLLRAISRIESLAEVIDALGCTRRGSVIGGMGEKGKILGQLLASSEHLLTSLQSGKLSAHTHYEDSASLKAYSSKAYVTSSERISIQSPPPIATPAPEAPAVEFTVYHPMRVFPDSWCTLLAYAHLPSVRAAVNADSKERLKDAVGHEHESAEALSEIARGAEIQIVPELPGCQINPPYVPVLWLEDWHRAEFRARIAPGLHRDTAVNGTVWFYVESVLVGEVPIWAHLSNAAGPSERDSETDSASSTAYRAIFASYSHQDSDVVEGLEKAYKALGMTLLRDVETLRSGDKWNSALLGMIDRADIFQLYWSETARKSPYVEQKWRHALAQHKERFIRPVYWQKPMPDPPDELANLHFAFLPRADA